MMKLVLVCVLVMAAAASANTIPNDLAMEETYEFEILKQAYSDEILKISYMNVSTRFIIIQNEEGADDEPLDLKSVILNACDRSILVPDEEYPDVIDIILYQDCPKCCRCRSSSDQLQNLAILMVLFLGVVLGGCALKFHFGSRM